MKPEEYQKRKQIKPGQIKNPSRYAMNSIYSHRRPVVFPLGQTPVDDPATRGLTEEP
jgi:hypothetical protein